VNVLSNKANMERVMTIHDDYLTQIGMKTNVAKTEMQWMNYSCAKMAITLMNLDEEAPQMSLRLKHAAYRNDRLPGVASMMDSSRLKIGKHSLPNRLLCLRRVKSKWTDG